MKNIVICLLICCCLHTSIADLKEWQEYKQKHKKNYDGNEDKQRYAKYLENKKAIEEHNKKFERGDVKFKLKMNHFGDWLEHEMNNFLGAHRNISAHQSTKHQQLGGINPLLEATAPENKDWRNEGVVSGIRDQKNCGACWAFAAVAALESHYAITTGRHSTFSEQNLIDCSSMNHGCKGGNVGGAYDYIINNGGIDTRASYPFIGYTGQCNFIKENVGASISGYNYVVPNEYALKQVVGLVGPVAVAVDASSLAFKFYSNGVYEGSGCEPMTYNHAVTVIGYGTESYGDPYWIIKNSWSVNWGENGFMKMARGRDVCGVADIGVYPTGVSGNSVDKHFYKPSAAHKTATPLLILFPICVFSKFRTILLGI